MQIQRRTVLGGALAGAASLAFPSLVQAQAGSAHVVVVGGGFGGATAARYLRLRAPQIQVTLVEPAERFYTCPFSNLYLAGLRSWDSIGHSYDGLRKAGVNVVQASAEAAISDAIDAIKAAKDAGATPEQLDQAYTLHRDAQLRWDFVDAESSMGFHSPQEATRALGHSADLARQAQLEASRVLASLKQ